MYTDPTGHFKLKDWIGHAVGAVMGVIGTVASGGNVLVGLQIYSFVSSGINSAISGDFGAFAIGTAASFAFSGFVGGIRDAMVAATRGISDAFIRGAIVGAVELGAGGFISGFVTEYARTGSGSSALRGGAWGAIIGGATGAIIVGSYNAGWQSDLHAWNGKDVTNDVKFNKTRVRAPYGGIAGADGNQITSSNIGGEASYAAVEYSCKTSVTEAKISLDKACIRGKVSYSKTSYGVYGEVSFKVVEGSTDINFTVVDTNITVHTETGYGVGYKSQFTVDQKGVTIGGNFYLGPGAGVELRFEKKN